jgi:hypothetical protein
MTQGFRPTADELQAQADNERIREAEERLRQAEEERLRQERASEDVDPTGDIATALEAGHRPILTPGAAIFDLPRRFLLNRYEDPEGPSGVGAVAWGCLWPSGRVSLDWQTEHAMRGGYYDTMEDVLALHGRQTAVEWVDK